MSDLAIHAAGLSKQYRIGKKQRVRRLTEAIVDAVNAPLYALRHMGEPLPSAEMIWALKDVSFDVTHGEVLGLIGRNGAGKSTLLKILSRITTPTEGTARILGRVGSLLEVGTGFHPELTGRENVYLNGAILGMTQAEITRKFDEIVSFAGVDQFIDTPIKRYSSGMGMRLAFSVSAHLDAEILLVDEVLAVGDVAFQNKCMGKMDEVSQGGRTVIFVSHNMGAISRLCSRVIWLEQGHVVQDGEAKDVIAEYMTSASNQEGQYIWPNGLAARNVNQFKVRAIRIVNQAGEITSMVSITEPFIIEIDFEVIKTLPYCMVGFDIENASGVSVFQTFDADNVEYSNEVTPGHYVARCEVPSPLLNSGRYFINVLATMPGRKILARADSVLSCQVVDTDTAASRMITERKGLIHARFKWTRDRI